MAPDAHAATTTVCASGCDYDRLEDAFGSGLAAGDVVTVGATYDLTGDNTFLVIPSEVTLDCENSGAPVGSTDFYSPSYLGVGASSTVQNCSLSNAGLTANSGLGVTVKNNTFTGNSQVNVSNSTSALIQNNSGQFLVQVYNAENSVVDSNTISPDINTTFGQNYISLSNVTNTTITNNQLITTAVNDPYYHDYIWVNDSDTMTIQNNLIDQSSIQTSSNSTGIHINGVSHIDISRNRLLLGGLLGSGQTMIGIQLSGGNLPTIADVSHNTIKFNPYTCNDCAGFAYTNWSVTNPVTADVTYNLIAGSSSSTANQSGLISYGGSGGGLNINQSWMGFAGLRNVNNSSDVATGPDAVIMNSNAAFKDEDATSTNDWELAPYSNFLDINGATDAGAVAGVRGNTFAINQAGTIDYVTVHATDTTRIAQHLRTNDTLNLATGTYSPISLTQGDRLTSNLTIHGSGPGTVIQYSGIQGSALNLNGISSSTFSNVTFSGSAVTTTYGYTLTKALYSYGGNDYDQAGSLGASPTAALLIGPGCAISAADAPTDITNTVGINSSDWNIALVQAFGFRLVAYVPNAVAANGTQLNSQCGFTVDAFVNSALIANGNHSYTYDASAVTLAGVTLKTGESAPSITSIIKEKALISVQAYSFGGNDYTDSAMYGAPTNNQILLLSNPCTASYVAGPSTLLPVPDTGFSNWNIFLLEQGGFHATVLAPANLADSPGDIAACGVTVDAFVPDVFIYNNGSFTYNAAAISGAGLTLVAGQPNPPYFTPIDYTFSAAGIYLTHSDGNTFTNVTSTGNDDGFVLIHSSQNAFNNSSITANNINNLVSVSDGENSLLNSVFDANLTTIIGDGGLTASFDARVHVQDGAGFALNGMNVTITSANNATTVNMTTDVSGNTNYVTLPAFRLSATDITATAGGYNPQAVHVDPLGPTFERNVTSTLNTPYQTIVVNASISSPAPTTQSGGVAMPPVTASGANNNALSIALDHVESLGNNLANIWVRLNADPNTVRGFALSTDPEFKNASLQNYQSLAAIAVSTITGKATIYGRYYSTTGQASAVYSLVVNLATDTGTPTAPTSPATPNTPGNAPTQCMASPFTRDLQTGMDGEDVRQLQQFLNAQGFILAIAGAPGSKGHETTRFGAATRGALKAFQKAHTFAETGILSGQTRTLVQRLTTKVVVCKSDERFPRDLRAGMTSDDVKALQQFLNAQGFTVAKAGEPGSKGFETRFFGNATYNALKAFQKANKLTETGILSGATLQKANQLAGPKTPYVTNPSPFMKYITWEVK